MVISKNLNKTTYIITDVDDIILYFAPKPSNILDIIMMNIIGKPGFLGGTEEQRKSAEKIFEQYNLGLFIEIYHDDKIANRVLTYGKCSDTLMFNYAANKPVHDDYNHSVTYINYLLAKKTPNDIEYINNHENVKEHQNK